MAKTGKPPTNPFRFGGLALDEAFANREAEVQELKFDVLNGQDVVIFAPRRYGKSSLVWKAMQQLVGHDVRVAYVNLMTTPTKAKLAEKLAAAIYEYVAPPAARARERALAPFRGLRISPRVTVNPETGAYHFSFGVDHSPTDLEATLERLLELPAELAADEDRRVALIFDEFQEVETIDPGLPKLMRTVFEQQPEVAHVYLGSRRHMMERLFNDRNEPFWRSAKKVELEPDRARAVRGLHPRALPGDQARTRRRRSIAELLERTGGHPVRDPGALLLPLGADAVRRRRRARRPRRGPGRRAALGERAFPGPLGGGRGGAEARPARRSRRSPGRPLTGAYRARHELPGPEHGADGARRAPRRAS